MDIDFLLFVPFFLRTYPLAYDWNGDQELLEGTFPDMFLFENRLQNFIDLKMIWFKTRDDTKNKSNSTTTPTATITTTATSAAGTAPTTTTTKAENYSRGSAPTDLLTGMLEAWSSSTPNLPGMFTIPGGLSGMLVKLCGHKLDKSEQCSQWEQRPLTASQLHYAGNYPYCRGR